MEALCGKQLLGAGAGLRTCSTVREGASGRCGLRTGHGAVASEAGNFVVEMSRRAVASALATLSCKCSSESSFLAVQM